jgi:hypothetical protein
MMPTTPSIRPSSDVVSVMNATSSRTPPNGLAWGGFPSGRRFSLKFVMVPQPEADNIAANATRSEKRFDMRSPSPEYILGAFPSSAHRRKVGATGPVQNRVRESSATTCPPRPAPLARPGNLTQRFDFTGRNKIAIAAVEVFPAPPEAEMRTIVASLAIVALLTSSGQAKAQLTDAGFNLNECVANATHILIVDSQGSVLEVWKGDARLREVIPIHALANLTVTQPSSRRRFGLGGGPTTYLSLDPWWGAGGERVILFLTKTNAPDPTHGRLGSWRPASKHGFNHSYASVGSCGSVYVQPTRWIGGTGIPDSGFRSSEESFKECVFKELNQPLPAAPKK